MKRETFKVRAIKKYDDYTIKDKVYEFIDGQTTWECGKSCFYENFEDFMSRNPSFYGNIEELKEGDVIMKRGNFKVRATKDLFDKFKKDKIYEYKDGIVEFESGEMSGYYASFEDLLSRNYAYHDGALVETTESTEEEVIVKDTITLELTKEEHTYITNLILEDKKRLSLEADRTNTLLDKIELTKEQ